MSRGAGILPFSQHQGEVRFLFQTVFDGRKMGYLNDFGGGVEAGEEPGRAALREFIEETETLYLAEDLEQTRRCPQVIEEQLEWLYPHFRATRRGHPDWCCRRESVNPDRPKDWTTFFVRIPHRALEPLNRAWEADQGRRFKKRRQLFWIEADRLLWLYRHNPQALWKRVRQLQGVEAVVQSIRACHTEASG